MVYNPPYEPPGMTGVYVHRSGAWNPWDGSASIDFTVDVEIDGSEVTVASSTEASSGDNVVLSVGASDRCKLYRLSYSPTSDITGTVIIKSGSTVLSQVYNPKAGSQYGFNLSPNFQYGALGDDVIINLPDTTSTHVDIVYEVVTP